ncbi:MAG: teicoplanin resistance protein VanZ [Candidatus Altiarchaeales archaeon ex4484_96]|nr:MAG: teicoplanin resistance protein VanZ [Candidatus Altiarchaeales archaeon ex4484_96]
MIFLSNPRIFWIITLFYLLIIFMLSSLSHPPQPLENNIFPVLAHLVEYTILGILLYTSLHSTLDIDPKKILFLAFLFSSFYGLTDELHQFFVPGRHCSLLDLVVDVLGSFIGASLSFLKSKSNPGSSRS